MTKNFSTIFKSKKQFSMPLFIIFWMNLSRMSLNQLFLTTRNPCILKTSFSVDFCNFVELFRSKVIEMTFLGAKIGIYYFLDYPSVLKLPFYFSPDNLPNNIASCCSVAPRARWLQERDGSRSAIFVS